MRTEATTAFELIAWQVAQSPHLDSFGDLKKSAATNIALEAAQHSGLSGDVINRWLDSIDAQMTAPDTAFSKVSGGETIPALNFLELLAQQVNQSAPKPVEVPQKVKENIAQRYKVMWDEIETTRGSVSTHELIKAWTQAVRELRECMDELHSKTDFRSKDAQQKIEDRLRLARNMVQDFPIKGDQHRELATLFRMFTRAEKDIEAGLAQLRLGPGSKSALPVPVAKIGDIQNLAKRAEAICERADEIAQLTSPDQKDSVNDSLGLLEAMAMQFMTAYAIAMGTGSDASQMQVAKAAKNRIKDKLTALFDEFQRPANRVIVQREQYIEASASLQKAMVAIRKAKADKDSQAVRKAIDDVVPFAGRLSWGFEAPIHDSIHDDARTVFLRTWKAWSQCVLGVDGMAE